MAVFPGEAGSTTQFAVRMTEFVDQGSWALQLCGRLCLSCSNGRVVCLSDKAGMGQTGHEYCASQRSIQTQGFLHYGCLSDTVAGGLTSITKRAFLEFISPAILLQCLYFPSPREAPALRPVSSIACCVAHGLVEGNNCGP